MRTPTILLKTGGQSWRNTLQHGVENRRQRLLEGIGFLVLIVALYVLGRTVLDQVGEHHIAGLLQAMNIFVMFGILVLARDSMEGTLKHLYEAPDTTLLLSMPLPPATVFGFKFIVLIASNLLNMGVWLIPPWVAFGQLFDLPWHFYLVLIPISFCLLITIVSQVVIVMLVYLRFFTSRRIIQILKVICTVIGVAVGFLLSMSLIASDQSDKVVQFLLKINIPGSDWQPHLWGAKLLIGWHPGTNVEMWRWGAQLIAATIGFPILAVLLASQIYHRSWEYAKRVEVGPKRARTNRTEANPSLPRKIGRGRLRSMIAKDFLVFIRHRGRMMVVIMLTVAVLIAMFSVYPEYTEMRQDDSAPVWIASFTVFIGVSIVLYSVMITTGLTWNGFKAEAQTWWLLKSCPVTPELLFNSKFLTATLCSVLYTDFWMLATLVLFRVPIQFGLLMLLWATLTTAIIIAFNTAIGTLPWMAEIQRADQKIGSGLDATNSHQFSGEKRPILRIATLLSAVIANIILIIGPVLLLIINLFDEIFDHSKQISLSVKHQIIIGVTMLFMVGVWYISYLMGQRSLRKLLG